jgi:hypothetical protein
MLNDVPSYNIKGVFGLVGDIGSSLSVEVAYEPRWDSYEPRYRQDGSWLQTRDVITEFSHGARVGINYRF